MLGGVAIGGSLKVADPIQSILKLLVPAGLSMTRKYDSPAKTSISLTKLFPSTPGP